MDVRAVDGTAGAKKTPIGYLPNDNDLDLRGLNFSTDNTRITPKSMPAAWKLENSEDGEILFPVRRPTAKENAQPIC